MEATIKFKNGTEITAEMNGGSFILPSKPAFPDDLSVVTIESEEGNKTVQDAQLVECASASDYWFSFAEKTAEQKQEEEITSLKEENQFLIGCIMEISEEVWK